MKILIQKDSSKADDIKLLSYQLLEDSDSIKWEISEVEPLVEKEKHTVVYKWDKTNSKVIGEYVPIPKTETEKLQEQVALTQLAVTEFYAEFKGVSTTDSTPPAPPIPPAPPQN